MTYPCNVVEGHIAKRGGEVEISIHRNQASWLAVAKTDDFRFRETQRTSSGILKDVPSSYLNDAVRNKHRRQMVGAHEYSDWTQELVARAWGAGRCLSPPAAAVCTSCRTLACLRHQTRQRLNHSSARKQSGLPLASTRQGCGACYANRNAHQIQHPFANWWAWVCAPIAAHSLHGGHGSLVRQLDNISSV
jgi:hypothetical protein